MKKNLIFTLIAVMALFGATACVDTIDADKMLGTMDITVVNDDDALATKADSGVDILAGEDAAKDAQVFLFDASGNLYRKFDITGGTGNTLSKTEEGVKIGTYTVAVVLNGLAAGNAFASLNTIGTLTALRAAVVTLASSVPGAQFTMYGEKADVNVAVGGTARAEISVKRFVSRIRLVSVKNALPEAYGALTVNNVFVINALSSWNLAGSDNPAGKFNWGGRKENKSESSSKSDFIAAAADCSLSGVAYGAQTFASPGTSVPRNLNSGTNIGSAFYVYPNATADDKGGNTFQGPISMNTNAPTRLVVVATINQVPYYYPVTVPAMSRNNTYDIALTIKGFGSDDPNKEVLMGNMSVTVNIAGWNAGNALTPEI